LAVILASNTHRIAALLYASSAVARYATRHYAQAGALELAPRRVRGYGITHNP